ncbi:DUF1003 domain-containing protein [Flavobacterium sp. 3HN19-14]|uniref:DUF1003 domain-containing protein n=1 Tax=Flavobacterium sp. 3HN19-14 TaxID=3448133 RepID=UPI003EE3F2A3
MIQADFPDFSSASNISVSELNVYREKYISDYLSKETGNLSDMETAVLEAMKTESLLSVGLADNKNDDFTFGQKVADKVATFGGSWTFIITFSVFILLWISANIYFLGNKGFDPYPFILLNLILSCLAALQAPVIMMSQNRQEEKDRDRAKDDYMINLKSEMEIRTLHEKLDHLILHQQKELIEIQKIQIEMMNDILSKIKD